MKEPKGTVYEILFFDQDHRQILIKPQYIALPEDEHAAFTVMTEDITGCDVYLKRVNKGGAFEPVAKKWVSELDKHIIIYERWDPSTTPRMAGQRSVTNDRR